MNNKVLYGIMCILFNSIGVPCFMRGDVKTGILRIVLDIVTCGILGMVNAIMGIILGIKVLTMSDEDYEANKADLVMGVPSGKPKAE